MGLKDKPIHPKPQTPNPVVKGATRYFFHSRRAKTTVDYGAIL